jgi:hypothetical protein
MSGRSAGGRAVSGLVLAVLLAGRSARTPPTPAPTRLQRRRPRQLPCRRPRRGSPTWVRRQRDVTSRSDDMTGTTWVIREHFRCTNDTNDPRVNGQADHDFVTTLEPADSPAGRWVGDLATANAGGTWKGKGAGAVVLWPSSDSGVYPRLLDCGVDYYTGSGGYEGPLYREFVGAVGDETADISGWIETR